MKNVMTIAWGIAKEAVVKFGGKAKEYFATSLKMAWGIVKNEAGAFNTDAVRFIGRQGDKAIIAIPAEFEVERVIDFTDLVRKGKAVKTRDGVDYMVYHVASGSNFRIVTKEATYLFRADDKSERLYFNGKK